MILVFLFFLIEVFFSIFKKFMILVPLFFNSDIWFLTFMMAGGAISWRSVKQTLTATSTMEVEFVSCFEVTSHGIWIMLVLSSTEF